jgi:hypothetical protein
MPFSFFFSFFSIPILQLYAWRAIQDYYATIYSAEIVNAFTNLLFLALGLRGIRNCLKYGHDTIFTVSFLGYILVGAGSFLFHSTLKCWWLHRTYHARQVVRSSLLIRSARSHAACRWTFDDIYNLPDVLRMFLLWNLSCVLTGIGN